MKQRLSAAVFICILLSLCSCRVAYGKPIEPLEETVYNFDLSAAEQMIAPGEKLWADITAKSSVTRRELDELLDALSQLYGDEDSLTWVYMLVDNREYEDESVNAFEFNDRLFYPTIYHQDVEIVSATVADYYYEDPSLDMGLLTITVAYTGDDDTLEGWQRDYVYVKSDGNDWVYDHGAGGNAFGNELTHDYLPLKQ